MLNYEWEMVVQVKFITANSIMQFWKRIGNAEVQKDIWQSKTNKFASLMLHLDTNFKLNSWIFRYIYCSQQIWKEVHNVDRVVQIIMLSKYFWVSEICVTKYTSIKTTRQKWEDLLKPQNLMELMGKITTQISSKLRDTSRKLKNYFIFEFSFTL